MCAAVLMVGTGEYTTGVVSTSRGEKKAAQSDESASDAGTSRSDKKVGVVALCFFELRRLGLVGDRLVMCGRDSSKFARIRAHFAQNVRYTGMKHDFEAFGAAEGGFDAALASMNAGDLCVIFTPDDTHFELALAALRAGLHVLVTKPAVKTLQDHLELVRVADENAALLCVEVHKRWDPLYSDAQSRIRAGEFGHLSYSHAYMSQPALQLDTFRAWAGKSSDISYYLNSHHVDFFVWALGATSRATRVTASAATGVATERLGRFCEDTITLQVSWEHVKDGSRGTSVFTASWVAPEADVHSHQNFFFLGTQGQLSIDQAHRGYAWATDRGLQNSNPLFMKYTPDPAGYFDGHRGYGYRSFEAFVLAANAARSGVPLRDAERGVASARSTVTVTAILHAGRMSLDDGGRAVDILYDESGSVRALVPASESMKAKE